MTEKLYYADAYTRQFTARVLSCEKTAAGWAVELDRTAFYPEGGGQAGDTGILGGSDVLDTRETGEKILHICRESLEPGSQVSGEIDWARRFDLMQQHSGEHIVSGLIATRFGYDNVGFHMGAAVTAIDFNGLLAESSLAEIERAANEIVWQDIPLEISWPGPEEIKTLAYRSKKELTGAVRIVTIPGADVCACCGTHVSRTGEIGPIKILSCQKLRQGVRLELLCGARAYDYLCAVERQNRQVSVTLSAKVRETAAAVSRLREEYEGLKYRATGFKMRLRDAVAAQYEGAGDVLLFEPGLASEDLRRLCDAVMGRCGGRCAVFSGDDRAGYQYAIGQAQGDLRPLVKEMNAALSGRGGGKPGFAQGSLKAARREIEAFFAAH